MAVDCVCIVLTSSDVDESAAESFFCSKSRYLNTPATLGALSRSDWPVFLTSRNCAAVKQTSSHGWKARFARA